MTGFIVFAVVVLISVGFVFKLMMSESKEEQAAVVLNPDDIKKDGTVLKPPSVEKEKKAPKPERPLRKSIIGALFQKIKTLKKNREDVKAMDTAAFSIKEALEKSKGSDPIEDPAVSLPEVGTMAVRTSPKFEPKALSKEEELKIEKEIEVSSQLDELKEKHERLDKLFKEKSDEFIKIQAALDAELRNRKEFNKVKDILEKEISDTKDKLRKAQVETSTAKTEADSYKKRINILEEKTTRLEKDIISKEHEIDNLVKRLQTFASPGTAHKPPVKEEVVLVKPEQTALPPEPVKFAEPEIPLSKPALAEPEIKAIAEPIKPNEEKEEEEVPSAAVDESPALPPVEKEEGEAPQSESGLSLKPDVVETSLPESPVPVKEEKIPTEDPQPKLLDKPANPDMNKQPPNEP